MIKFIVVVCLLFVAPLLAQSATPPTGPSLSAAPAVPASAPVGGLTGSGAANQIAVWSGTSSLIGYPALTFNGSLLATTVPTSIDFSSSASLTNALLTHLGPGYSGGNTVVGAEIYQETAGISTGSWLFSAGQGNQAARFTSQGTTAGHNVGLSAGAFFSSVQNVGAFLQAQQASALNIGAVAQSQNPSGIKIGLFSRLVNSASFTTPTFTTSAALMADNTAVAADIFVARDNGTPVFTIADGGAVTATTIKTNDGTSGAPAYSFTSDSSDGMSHDPAGVGAGATISNNTFDVVYFGSTSRTMSIAAANDPTLGVSVVAATFLPPRAVGANVGQGQSKEKSAGTCDSASEGMEVYLSSTNDAKGATTCKCARDNAEALAWKAFNWATLTWSSVGSSCYAGN